MEKNEREVQSVNFLESFFQFIEMAHFFKFPSSLIVSSTSFLFSVGEHSTIRTALAYYPNPSFYSPPPNFSLSLPSCSRQQQQQQQLLPSFTTLLRKTGIHPLQSLPSSAPQPNPTLCRWTRSRRKPQHPTSSGVQHVSRKKLEHVSRGKIQQ